MLQQKIKPRFEVHKCDTPLRRVCIKLEEGTFEYKDQKDDRQAYMVYFPGGHSIRVIGEDNLRLLGFDGNPELVDMNTGDIVGEVAATSLKEMSERVTKPSKRSGVTDDE